MFKKIISFFVSFVLLFCLTSCASPANDVSKKIEAIGEVTIDSEPVIAEAEEAYAALSDGDKAKVKNYDILVEARKKLDKEKTVLTLCGEWTNISNPELKWTLNEDRTAILGGTQGTWELNDDLSGISLNAGMAANVPLEKKGEYYILNLGSQGNTLMRTEDYNAFCDTHIVSVDLNDANYTQYIGEAVCAGPETDAFGEETDEMIWYFPSLAYENEGLVYFEGINPPIAAKIIVTSASGYTYDYIEEKFSMYDPFRERKEHTPSIEKMTGTVKFIKKEFVESVDYEVDNASNIIFRVVTTTEGIRFYLGFSGVDRTYDIAASAKLGLKY